VKITPRASGINSAQLRNSHASSIQSIKQQNFKILWFIVQAQASNTKMYISMKKVLTKKWNSPKKRPKKKKIE